jgi:hypothetical protein
VRWTRAQALAEAHASDDARASAHPQLARLVALHEINAQQPSAPTATAGAALGDSMLDVTLASRAAASSSAAVSGVQRRSLRSAPRAVGRKSMRAMCVPARVWTCACPRARARGHLGQLGLPGVRHGTGSKHSVWLRQSSSHAARSSLTHAAQRGAPHSSGSRRCRVRTHVGHSLTALLDVWHPLVSRGTSAITAVATTAPPVRGRGRAMSKSLCGSLASAGRSAQPDRKRLPRLCCILHLVCCMLYVACSPTASGCRAR